MSLVLQRGVLAAALMASPVWALATMVRVDTVSGPIDIALLDEATPRTVANFLAYVRRGAYDNSFFHRLMAGFVLQGGGFTIPPLTKITTDPPVVNEFSATHSNLRGTVAMAKPGGNPNSATTEWFVNLANNSANLDNQNGGFTVFGRVTTPSMVTVDAFAALSTVNAGPTATSNGCGSAYSALGSLPLLTPITKCSEIGRSTVVLVNTARELPAAAALSNTDRVLNYLEAAYPQYVQPASPPTLNADGYVYRYYAKSSAYVGSKDGNVYYLVPAISDQITLLGSVADWLATANAAGY